MVEDQVYVANRIIALLGLDTFEFQKIESEVDLTKTLKNLLDYAVQEGVIEKDIVALRDVFDSKLMNELMKRPSEVIKDFNLQYSKSSKAATDWFYKLNKNSNYIRTNRIAKNMKWKAESDYGLLDITINLSKPEKTPEEIVMASKAKATSYPKCYLCKENEGYEGRVDHPGRANHRVIPMKLNDEDWFFQYSPYSYFNEHAIVFKGSHDPMKISLVTFNRLLDFIKKFPHYFLGSNADLPIVGGSILSHDHFQGGCYEFPIEKAKSLLKTKIEGYPGIDLSIVDWPMSVVRVSGSDKERLAELAWNIAMAWKNYNDESVGIISKTQEEHNTVTPIARFKNNQFEIDLVLRNNRTTEEFPMGIFHPHADVHHIKKENIGLIEVMGLAVLPKRLKSEINSIKDLLISDKEIPKELEDHRQWILEMKDEYSFESDHRTMEIIKDEIGKKFTKVLEYAGVFKTDEQGFTAFKEFVKSIKDIE
jgi:UDPglucose--hexose-1-phosphate uridylyltransferase